MLGRVRRARSGGGEMAVETARKKAASRARATGMWERILYFENRGRKV